MEIVYHLRPRIFRITLGQQNKNYFLGGDANILTEKTIH